MRSKDIPAEVLRVEDRIIGSISLKQTLLLLIPLAAGLLLILAPPVFSWHAYKTLLIVEAGLVSGLLAIRLQGRLLLEWLTIIYKFHRRPKIYRQQKKKGGGNDYIRQLR